MSEQTETVATNASTTRARVDYAIALGDDALVLGQRLTEWCSRAPYLEEDLALANVALDFIGRARLFYTHAGQLEARGRSEDDIAFLRDAREYTNLLIHELPRGDFAFTMVRQYLIDAFNVPFLEALCDSDDPQLAAIAEKTLKESRYHLRRSREWVVRLGDGTDESQQRTQGALRSLWGYTPELFQMTPLELTLLEQGIAVDRAALRDVWQDHVDSCLREASLQRPTEQWQVSGGRDGIHTEHLAPMLAQMQYLQRAYPGLQW
ncbi:MAG: phenylacetate-CoA oxygenase subunit PaaC [Gammaproteobacteria bacterium]|nr:phenylacetate-CoA oxygenase subunit PaaC [Gammaproteobacteria bacterium]